MTDGNAAREWGAGWATLKRLGRTRAWQEKCEREARRMYELGRVLEDDGA